MAELTINLKKYSDYESLPAGIYTLGIVAKADGYSDSAEGTLTFKKPYQYVVYLGSDLTLEESQYGDIYPQDSIYLNFDTSSSQWSLPSSVTVTGADQIWNASTGSLKLSNPTANVSVTIAAVATMCSITYTGTKFTSSNNINSIAYGSNFSTVLSPETGYIIKSVVVKKGSETLSGAYTASTQTVSVSSVDANISITVITQEKVASGSDPIQLNGTETIQMEESTNATSYSFKVGSTDVGTFTPNDGDGTYED